MVDRRAAGKPVVAPKAALPHAAFGRLVDQWMRRAGMSNEELGRALGYENGEMVRRYRGGLAMPRSDKLKKLANLMNVDVSLLLYGEKSHERTLVGMMGEAGLDLTADEQHLIKAYRKLPIVARKAVRAHAVRLLEEHGLKDADNPFGKAGTQ
jgi:transcriptional regulator with XRE-family HTH domain